MPVMIVRPRGRVKGAKLLPSSSDRARRFGPEAGDLRLGSVPVAVRSSCHLMRVTTHPCDYTRVCMHIDV